jgi:SAM-dependent methyltransferase
VPPIEDRDAAHRDLWATLNRDVTDDDADRRWTQSGVAWGLFGVPETRLGTLGEVRGAVVAELGCGTAYLSAQLARLGARPIAVDLSPDQLHTARRCQQRYGPTFPLVEATAEQLPLRDRCVDLVISEYGAAPWCEPRRWLAEAARILRPGGRLVFLTNSPLAALCVPEAGGFAGERLLRGTADVARIAWPGGGEEFHPTHGDWVSMLLRSGFVVEALHELRPDAEATTPETFEIVTVEWARRWPAEDLWVARRD